MKVKQARVSGVLNTQGFTLHVGRLQEAPLSRPEKRGLRRVKALQQPGTSTQSDGVH